MRSRSIKVKKVYKIFDLKAEIKLSPWKIIALDPNLFSVWLELVFSASVHWTRWDLDSVQCRCTKHEPCPFRVTSPQGVKALFSLRRSHFLAFLLIFSHITLRRAAIFTSSAMTNCLAVGADTIMRRAVGEIKPSSTALSMKDNKEL